MRVFALVISCFISLSVLLPLHAEDILLTKNGARLVGEVQKVEKGKLHLKTNYAGTIEVALNKIQIAEVETELIWKLKDQSSVKGVLRNNHAKGGWVLVTNSADRSVALNQVERAWLADNTNSVVGDNKKLSRMINVTEPRDWSLELGLNIRGKEGNSDRFSSALTGELTIQSEHDRLQLYGSYDYTENNSRRIEDELIGGVTYTNFFFDRFGWFAREELERDEFENVKFRSTSGFGFSYRMVRNKSLTFETRAGLSYRYEKYFSDTIINGEALMEAAFPGLDFGLTFNWRFAEWGRLRSDVNFVPSFSSFSEYLVEQDTGVYLPLASSDAWKLRIGFSNQYNSNPDTNREKLDTSYYLRLIYSLD